MADIQTLTIDLATAMGGDIKALTAKIGTLTNLSTSNKTSLVTALNSLYDQVQTIAASGGAVIADGATASGTVWSSTKTNAAIVAAVSAGIANLVGSAPGTLDTLQEIAAELASDDSAFAALVSTVAGKAPMSHTHDAADINAGTLASARLPAASTTVVGAVELATTLEAAGTSAALAVTPAGLRAVVGDTSGTTPLQAYNTAKA